MNSIVFTDFVTPARGASRLDTALGHLGTWAPGSTPRSAT
jgi:hypothetical protein